MRGHTSSYDTAAGRRWRIVYDLPPGEDGKRRRTTRRGFTSEAEAHRALRVALGAVDEGTHVDPSTVSVAGYLRAWIEGAQVRPTTLSRYRQSIERHLVPHLGGIRLQALTVEDLDRCYATLVRQGGAGGRPLAPKTVRNAHGVLRTALRDAVQRGYLARNVAEHARLPRVERREMVTWTAGQLRTFLDHVAEDRLTAMWTLYATTGMRRGEVLGLRWHDIDLEVGQLTVRHVLTVVEGRPVVTEPKTAKGRRTIALDGSTVAALRRHRVRQLEERVAADVAWHDGGYVFTWQDGRPLHPQMPTKWIRELAAAAGLPPLTVHGLRHTWASLALAAGVPAKVVSERLGHANISITMDVYTHALPAMDREAADRVAGAIFGGVR
jgi:integrase